MSWCQLGPCWSLPGNCHISTVTHTPCPSPEASVTSPALSLRSSGRHPSPPPSHPSLPSRPYILSAPSPTPSSVPIEHAGLLKPLHTKNSGVCKSRPPRLQRPPPLSRPQRGRRRDATVWNKVQTRAALHGPRPQGMRCTPRAPFFAFDRGASRERLVSFLIDSAT